jgi:predicted FMN-binding regulatory protein PaiB
MISASAALGRAAHAPFGPCLADASRAALPRPWLSRQIRDLTRLQERIRREPWSVDDAPDEFVATQLRAIVGIEIPIGHLEASGR